jgi:hypothetical protein
MSHDSSLMFAIGDGSNRYSTAEFSNMIALSEIDATQRKPYANL